MSTWGFATSLAMAIVALSAPFLGVFGDIRGMRKKLFTAFMLIGVVSVAGLSFTPFVDFTASPEAAGRVAAMVLVLYITSTIGFDASCIYYDAFLTDVTTEDRMDSVSTLGYGLGYIGGSTIPLLIFLIMNAVGVPMLTSLAIIFAITAVWWLVFSVPLVKNCEQTSGKPYKKGDVGASIKNVFTTMKEIGADKPMLIYIISYFFYIDGVHTIISMSTSYGTNLGLDPAGMLLALLLVLALAGTLLFSTFRDKIEHWEYPQRFTEYVEYYAGKYGIDPMILYAFIRTESGFDPQATSSVDARGLMQMTEETFLWLRSKIAPDEPLTFADLYSPDTAIRFGCYYLHLCMVRYKGDVSTTAAAYHSGWGTVDQLLQMEEHSADGETLQGFPYNQMHHYVNKITACYQTYQRLYAGQ